MTESVEETQKIDTSMFVPMHYDMDPETEDVIHGDDLEQSMIVLIEDSMVRENPDRLDSDAGGYVLARLKENNQWCRVTDLRRRGDLITFIGVYEDGVKRARTFNESYCWIIRKNYGF